MTITMEELCSGRSIRLHETVPITGVASQRLLSHKDGVFHMVSELRNSIACVPAAIIYAETATAEYIHEYIVVRPYRY